MEDLHFDLNGESVLLLALLELLISFWGRLVLEALFYNGPVHILLDWFNQKEDESMVIPTWGATWFGLPSATV